MRRHELLRSIGTGVRSLCDFAGADGGGVGGRSQISDVLGRLPWLRVFEGLVP